MRIIILLIFICSIAFSNNIFYEDYEKDMLQAKYQIGNFEITEYNCDCTLQENIFYIKDLKKNIIYRLDGVSKINLLDREIANNVNQWVLNVLKNIKLCENNLVELKNDMIYLYALSPENEDYTKHCYKIAGYINTNHIIVKFNDEIKIKSTIQTQKQPLYKEANKNLKTNMYLVKNDVVEILEEKDDWIYILYITKDEKEIKAWIPRNSLEFRSSNEE
ncbi:hypothetical protein AAX26_02039 [Aliarcobacter thereius]|uniref:hypothetical protein n=1 Tax=Aliarcobacter thereius TaxID=544718 RepID=UPI000828D446|nr:hypothetical protein [Aliarcobacter thereius]OCL85330.1 hypothetical protein AAX26_02039 [Aliarcobacter thereius]